MLPLGLTCWCCGGRVKSQLNLGAAEQSGGQCAGNDASGPCDDFLDP